MKSSTKTVGGNPNTALGQNWNQFLQSGLGGSNFGANAIGQTQGFGGAINNLLGGQIGDPKSLQGFFQNLQGTGGLPNLSGVSGNYNAPQFQGLGFGQMGQVGTQGPSIQQGQRQAGLNLSGLQSPQYQGFNLNQNVGGAQGLPGIQFNPAQFQNTQLQNPFGSAAGLDPNGSFSQALQQISQQGLDKAVADTRERYTGQQGTPAGFAEAALRAQLQPQLISQLSQANQQERGLNLQQLGMNQQALGQMNQLGLQQGLAGNQFNQANTQLGLNAQGINTGNILQNQGLQNQGQLGLNNQFLQGSQQANQFGLANAGLQQGQQQMLNQGLLSQMGLSNEAINALNQANLQGFGQQQQGQQQNVQNQMQQMQQMLQQSGLMNQFGQQNAQFGANFGQNAQQMNMQNLMQNQQMMNQFGLGMGGLGMQGQGQQLQGQLGALNQLFGGYQQAAGLGTPQAQTVQQPSPFSQAVGGLTSLGNMFKSFNPFSGYAPQQGGGDMSQYNNQGMGGGGMSPASLAALFA